MKRFKYLYNYIKLLKANKDTLLKSQVNKNPSGIKIDWLYRLYTVLNLPEDDEVNIKRYGIYYIDNIVKNHIVKINELLFQLGILEYVELDTKHVEQLDEFNIKIVLKFRYMNLLGWSRFLIFGLPLTLAGIIIFLINFIM